MTPLLALVYALTVYRLTRLVTADTFPPILKAREWVLLRWPSDDTTYADEYVTSTSGEPQSLGGAEVLWMDGEWHPVSPHWLGELVSCAWCASVWIATLTLPLFYLWPETMIWIGAIPAASAVAGLAAGRE